MRRLVRLYPRRWRERYGDELEQLLHDLGRSGRRAGVGLDLIGGAMDAHVQQGRRAIARTGLIVGVVWLALSAEILRSNVLFPSRADDDTVSVLLAYGGVFVALFLTGFLVARTGARRRGQILSGVVAGMAIGLLTIGTFAIVDNVWLDIVSQQQTKIEGFAHSGAASMRDFINQGLIGGAVALPLMLGVFGGLFALAGGLAAGPGRRPGAGSDGSPVRSG
jgi:hypothetical protein